MQLADRRNRHAVPRLDEHQRLPTMVVATDVHSHRAIRIAFEAARLVTLPTRAAPRTYIRKGVRYAVFAEDGVIWVVQQVDTPIAPAEPPHGAP